MFINKEDKAALDTIFEIEKSVFESYDKLRILESDEKTESEEYKSALATLNSTLFLENTLYEKLFANFENDPFKLVKLLSEITVPALAWDLDTDMYYAKEDDRKELIKRRVALRIFDKINSCRKRSPLASIVINSFTQNDSVKIRFTELSVAVRKDFINTFFTLLNMQIANETNFQIRFNLIKLKANIGFLYKFVEDDFLNNNFSINPEVYWMSYTIADTEQIDHKYVVDYQKSYASKMTSPIEELNRLSSKSDLEDNDNYFRAIVDQIIVRVSLLFGNDYMKKVLNDKIKYYTDKKEISDIFMITEALNMHEADKEIPKIISLSEKL